MQFVEILHTSSGIARNSLDGNDDVSFAIGK